MTDYKAQARALILRAGIAAFSERGYRNTTMERIAKDVGVTKADLYHYFPSKAALLRDIAAGFRGAFIASLSEAFRRADSTETLAKLIMRVLEREKPATRLWFDVIAESFVDYEAEELLRAQNREYWGAVRAAVAKLPRLARGAGGNGSADDRAMAVMLLIQGALLNIQMGAPLKETQRALQEGLRAVLGP